MSKTGMQAAEDAVFESLQNNDLDPRILDDGSIVFRLPDGRHVRVQLDEVHCYTASEIDWDVDDGQEVDLPSEVDIPVSEIDLDESAPSLEDQATDRLSDSYGWLVKNYVLGVVGKEDIK